MKKGQTYTGIVSRIKFPNKGIVNVTGIYNENDKVIIIPKAEEAGFSDLGLAVTVKGVIPGQKIIFRCTKKRSGSCEGNLISVLEKSPVEIESKCPHFSVCGGCSYQNLPYEEQLRLKEKQVHELLDPVIENGFKDLSFRFEKINSNNAGLHNVRFEEIKASPIQSGYRNKMEFSFGDSCKGGPLELGLHKSGSFYDIVSVCNCQIIDEDYREILKETLSFFRGKETPYYHKGSHEGFLRFLIVRKAMKTGEILIDLVTTSQTPKDTPCTEISLIDDYVNMLKGLKLKGTIAGILHTIDDAIADAVVNDHTDILYGKDYFYEEVLGLKFKITPFSFFQTNTLSAEVLYDTVRQYVNETSEDDKGLHKVLFDLYSGTGTITQLMSTIADKAIGVEIVGEAVAAAKENATLNGLHNCEFIAGDVLRVLDEIVDKPDFIILDPPRDGINPKALSKIIKYGVKNIVYVSCKPTSLARDLETMMAHGYIPVKICPLDQFPNTSMIETICLLTREDFG